jgi:hypothetical protein
MNHEAWCWRAAALENRAIAAVRIQEPAIFLILLEVYLKNGIF